ncbi:MAG: hypothetical protein JWM47_4513 [Acidimicrobiales bacterium]|nr:hypothetical protein [Acidimicrobiales bacterium]
MTPAKPVAPLFAEILEDARAVGHDPGQWQQRENKTWVLWCESCGEDAQLDRAGGCIIDNLQDRCELRHA